MIEALSALAISYGKFFCGRCKNQDLNPPTLPHNFWFMGGTFEGKMNQNRVETREAK